MAKSKFVTHDVVAWMHKDDPTRIVPDKTKQGALRDGGAISSSLKDYVIPCIVKPGYEHLVIGFGGEKNGD